MARALLVESDIERGNELIGILDKAGYPVHSALWLYSSDRYDEWRLVIATPLVDKEGPLAAYQKLDGILRKDRPDFVVSLRQIQLVSPTDLVIRSVNETYPTRESILNPTLFGSTSGTAETTTYIEQAHLYRVHGTNE
ncbi:MAG: hypothetical protein HQ567_07465 [Candidatus Nealsonbacteria bacterium]|nr:hypothetical protein [Candidatus Nealsonbacteria bacterium]